jgi:hypothetical protein
MKKRNLLFLLLLCSIGFGVNTPSAQEISIQISDYPAVGTQNKMLADSVGYVTVALGSTGAGRIWEFKQDLKAKEISYDYIPVASTPYAASVPGSEWAIKTKQWLNVDPVQLLLPNGIRGFFDVYYFLKENSSADEILGTGIGAVVEPYYSGGYPFTTPSVDFAFPLQIGKTWVRKATYFAPAKVSGLSTTLMMADSVVKVVDASGRLSIPYGSFDCVRIKSKRYITTKALLFTQYLSLSSDTLIQYEWIAKNVGLVLQVSSHGHEKNENFTDSGNIVRLSATSVPSDVRSAPDNEPQTQAPSRCSLGQNYPNPFNPGTSIPYVLTEPSRIELKVYTLLGQEAAVLYAGVKPAGLHSASWNGRDASGARMPSGVYFYRLKTTTLRDGQPGILTMKMIMTD